MVTKATQKLDVTFTSESDKKDYLGWFFQSLTLGKKEKEKHRKSVCVQQKQQHGRQHVSQNKY